MEIGVRASNSMRVHFRLDRTEKLDGNRIRGRWLPMGRFECV